MPYGLPRHWGRALGAIDSRGLRGIVKILAADERASYGQDRAELARILRDLIETDRHAFSLKVRRFKEC